MRLFPPTQICRPCSIPSAEFPIKDKIIILSCFISRTSLLLFLNSFEALLITSTTRSAPCTSLLDESSPFSAPSSAWYPPHRTQSGEMLLGKHCLLYPHRHPRHQHQFPLSRQAPRSGIQAHGTMQMNRHPHQHLQRVKMRKQFLRSQTRALSQ